MKPTELSLQQLSTAGRNTLLLREAELVAARLAERRIPVLFLKGVGLLEAEYVGLEQRGMADIDLLVRARHLGETSAVLRGQGYAPLSNGLLLRKRIGKLVLDLDLHGDLWYFGSEDPWRRSVAVGPGLRLRTLCPEDALLHAILHSVVQDGALSPRAMADCLAILENVGGCFRWEAFAATVAREGWEGPVALFLAGLEASHPGTVPAIVGGGAPPSRVRQAWGWRSPQPYRRMLQMQSRWSRKIGLALRILFPHPAFLRLRYGRVPRPLSPLLPILRPALLVAESLACRVGRFRS
jgi:hypothetical protein